MEFKKAQRKAKKLKIGIGSPSGFGKTYGSLLLAKGLVGDLSKVVVLDSENGSSNLYSDLGDYSVGDLKPPFTPESYIKGIKAAVEAGFECVIIDSISHEWYSEGGILSIVASLGNRYQDWAGPTKRHNALIDTILQSDIHVICTTRSKVEYSISKENDKTIVQKMGLGNITRDGFEYELDVFFDIINNQHLCKASKDRTRLFSDMPEFVITEQTGKDLINWTLSGAVDEEYETQNKILSIIRNSTTVEELQNNCKEHVNVIASNNNLKEAYNNKKLSLTNKTN